MSCLNDEFDGRKCKGSIISFSILSFWDLSYCKDSVHWTLLPACCMLRGKHLGLGAGEQWVVMAVSDYPALPANLKVLILGFSV